MPVTFRYGFVLGFMTGFVSSIYTRRRSTIFKCTVVGTLAFGLGTCYDEFHRILKIKYMPDNKD